MFLYRNINLCGGLEEHDILNCTRLHRPLQNRILQTFSGEGLAETPPIDGSLFLSRALRLRFRIFPQFSMIFSPSVFTPSSESGHENYWRIAKSEKIDESNAKVT